MATAAASAIAAGPVDYSRLKLLCILEGPGAAVMSYALKCGINKAASVTLLDYLASLPDTSTANYRSLKGEQKRKAFTTPEKSNITDDPSCQKFDITLLFKCIRLACENVAALNDARWQDDAQMEGLLTKIKAERNDCVHERPQMTDEQHFMKKVSDLKTLFSKALQAIKSKYGVSDAEITNVNDNIMLQMQDILQAFTEKVILQMNFNKRLRFFKEESVDHLRNIYEQFVYFDPLSFLSGATEERVHIQDVFSNLVLKEQSKDTKIDCLRILKFLKSKPKSLQPSQPDQDKRPQLAVVSGVAGSGKTTLLTLILSEWLKKACDRRVKHLEDYDIVLRIMCRDSDAPTLETFLSLILPSSLSVFNEPLVNFLKYCQVLFIIDGLDELNSTSENLVTDVLSVGRYTRNFSILVSSRPERVFDFLARTRQDYKQWQISIEGIPFPKRTEFALQYCTSINRDKLKELLVKRRNMELFELPLNLLFLVTLFEDNPDCIKENNTQSSLYTNIHEWCTEKLHHRISVDPTWGKKRPLTRNTRIKRVLKEMYQLALHGLLQNRLSLSDEDTERLADYCESEDLPTDQVLGAFFTLRASVTNRVVKKVYYIPHKGLLDYFAAQHIMRCLQDKFQAESGAIRSLLLDVLQPQKQLLDIKGLRNLFWHVAGLLSTPGTPKRPEAIREVVDLLAETGAEWNEWLSLVEDTHYDESFVQRIAQHVAENPPQGPLEIKDAALASNAALLPHIPSRQVKLKLENEKVDVNNIHALAGHCCSALYLTHHFKHPGHTPASDAVLHVLDKSHLVLFLGHLSAGCLALLPQSLKKLYLALPSDEHAGSLLAALNGKLPFKFSSLFLLNVHVPMVMVTPGALTSPLPDVCVVLTLSSVDKNVIKEACQVAAALEPRKRGYRVIRFPRARMKAADWRDLLHHLAAAKVRTECIEISKETVAKKEGRELEDLARNLLQCRFWRQHEHDCFLPSHES